MSGQFRVMERITASYIPYAGKKKRCSSNFKYWNVPKNGKLKFKIILPEGFPPLQFNLIRQKRLGFDKVFYANIYDGKEIDLNRDKLKHGRKKIYIETATTFPDITHTEPMLLISRNMPHVNEQFRDFEEVPYYEVIVYVSG